MTNNIDFAGPNAYPLLSLIPINKRHDPDVGQRTEPSAVPQVGGWGADPRWRWGGGGLGWWGSMLAGAVAVV